MIWTNCSLCSILVTKQRRHLHLLERDWLHMRLYLQRGSDIPLYRQVAEQIRALIRSGALPPGDRLPTVRQLATELGLTRLTVHSAYAELQAQGFLESFVGRGTFVVAQPPASAPGRPGLSSQQPTQSPTSWQVQGFLAEIVRLAERPDLLTFAQAHPAPETFPARELGKALRTALEDMDALGYGIIRGEMALREQVSRLLLERGITTAPDQVLITAGAQQGITLALGAFALPGEVVVIEEPTYPGVLQVAAQQGQRLVGIPRDSDGISLSALEDACRTYQPRLLYIVPTFHNPTGLSLSAERRLALLDIARRHHLLIVEDDVYGLLSYDEPAPFPLKAADEEEQIIYLTSFSKILMPGLRLGAIVASPAQLPALAALKQSTDLICSPLLQRALADYLRRGHLPAHLHQACLLYRARRDATLAALERFLPACTWTQPEGGLSVWVTLPEQVHEHEFIHEAIQRGIGVAPGRIFFSQPQQRAFMRLSFGAYPPARIEEGIATLGDVLRNHLRRQREVIARAGLEASPLV